MVAELHVSGAEKFHVLSKALKQFGDTQLEERLYSAIARAAEPLPGAVKKGAPKYLPRRYAVELAQSLRVETRRRGGRSPSLSLRGTAKTERGKDRDLASLNRGRLRHPLYGNRRYWYDQPVKQNWWDDPLIQGVDKVRGEITGVFDEFAREIAKKL